MNASFIHLRVHSAYSLLEGAIKIPELIDLCKKNHMPAVAITDTGNLFGALEFAIEATDKGIQPIIGCEIRIKAPQPTPTTKADIYDKLVLLVQNELGYKNLLKLVSASFLENDNTSIPHITWDHLKEPHITEGLIALSASEEGGVGRLLLEEKNAAAHQLAQDLAALFLGRFYIELQRHGMPSQEKIEAALLNIAYTLNLPLVATNNAFFPDSSMFEAHDALMCVADGTYVVEENRRHLTPHHSFKSAEEMVALFQDIPEAIQNTVNIAKRCSYMPEGRAPMLPRFESSEGRSEEDELRYQAALGLKKRLEKQVIKPGMDPDQISALQKQYESRLEYELNVIIQMGFSGYFLIVADFIQWAKNNGIPVGPGRGSGAGSLAAWSLTITDVDPIVFNLIFERFLNPERVSMPDFDIDFCQDRRDEVIHYVQQKYGKDRVAQIITFGKLQARAVLRDVGRVLQMPYPQVDRICKMIPNNPTNPVTLEEALAQEAELRTMREQDPSVAKLMDMAIKLEGLYRHASTHAAGLIIGDRPLVELIPLYKDPKSDVLVTQFSMKLVEKAGLVKFDFLGLKTLTVLERAAQMIRNRGEAFDLSAVPTDDKKTFDLLNRLETVGIFQLEGAGMRDVLAKLKPDRLDEIIALVALYRPGPMDDIPRYLACKHGEEQVHYAHATHEEILKESFGVMVYQEQVMQIAKDQAGYSLGAADLLRRAMGKKIKSEMDAQRRIFVEGSKKNGVEESKASQIFDQVAKFAGYGFPKAHAAPYALITYQTAYMKANHPLEFMAATMSYEMGNTDKLNIFKQELDHMGIPLLPPDVNKAYPEFTVEEGGIRYALAALKNVGEGAMEELTEERTKNGPFKSIEDFASRLSSKILNKRQMESLIAAGAFDSLIPNRRQLYESIEYILRYAHQIQQEKNSQQISLFGGGNKNSKLDTPVLVDVLDWESVDRLKYEFDAIGFYLTTHPLEAYKSFFQEEHIISSPEIEKHKDQTIKVVGIVSIIKERVSKAGKKFAFLSLTDLHGSFEVTLFSEIISKARDYLVPGTPLLLHVSVRLDEGGVRLIAQDVGLLESVFKNKKHTVTAVIKNENQLEKVSSFLKTVSTGNVFVRLILELNEGHQVSVKLDSSYNLTPKHISKLNEISLEENLGAKQAS